MGSQAKDVLVPVAQYLRKSTDYQKYSTENQSAANHVYAGQRGMEIVRTYADEGRSGLTFERRDALKRLIGDVQSGATDFAAILVYDVSRWGRFQDSDESGYYEYICKRAGVKVHYCAEQFDNDGSPFAAIVKSIKRAMAGEYSRELSVKSFVGQSRLVRLGFRAGASAGYGTQRLLIDQFGKPRCILTRGEYKSLATDRVVLIPGSPKEVRVVRWIFSLFVKRRKSVTAIVELLNKNGISSGLPRPWTYARVRKLLLNEIYISNCIWNRTSTKLGKNMVRNPPELWFRTKCSFAPIIDESQFEAAQKRFRELRQRPSKEEVLEALRRIHRKHGFLDNKLVQESGEVPSLTYLYNHFGGLRQVYNLIGSKARPGAVEYGLSNDELLVRLRRLLKKRGCLTEVIIDQSKNVPCASTYQIRFGSLSQAYQLIGYKAAPKSHQGSLARTLALTDDEALEALRKLLSKRGKLTQKIIDKSGETPSSPSYCRRFGSLTRTYELIGYAPADWRKRRRPAKMPLNA